MNVAAEEEKLYTEILVIYCKLKTLKLQAHMQTRHHHTIHNYDDGSTDRTESHVLTDVLTTTRTENEQQQLQQLVKFS